MNVDFLFPQDRLLNTSSELLDRVKIVTPAEQITSDTAFMRGHGTYMDGDKLIASVAGVIERVNKLISVKPLRSRYTGQIGDVVVGRITEVSQKRWKVDANGRQDSVLMLSSINLPGGIQRRKSESDELQMRIFFAEGDLVVAEVQAFFADGAVSLHTRNLKYGKLRNGSFVSVPPALVERCKSHFHTLPMGIDVILGLNGYIWVSKHMEPLETLDPEAIYTNKNEEITPQLRSTISRICNCILVLSRASVMINSSNINSAYEISLDHPVKDLAKLDVIQQIAYQVEAKGTDNMDTSL